LSLDSRDRLAKSEQLADRSSSSRGVQPKKFRLRHMQQSTACLHFGWRTTSLRVGGGATRRSCLHGVVAAVAVDRRARRSSLVWLGGVQ